MKAKKILAVLMTVAVLMGTAAGSASAFSEGLATKEKVMSLLNLL